MKTVISIPLYVLGLALAMSCCSTVKKSATAEVSERRTEKSDSIPVCVRQIISKYQQEEKQNPPRQIFQYSYHGRTVFYVTPPCCDFFSELYDSNCVLIAYPDGGITGKGDGRAPDFIDVRKDEKLIWKDERK